MESILAEAESEALAKGAADVLLQGSREQAERRELPRMAQDRR